MAEESQTTALHFLDYWRVIRDRKEVILAVALLTIVSGTAYTLMMPKKYTALTQIQVREDAMDVDPFYQRDINRMGYNPFFLMTQEKILKSKPVLTTVIRNLNLQKVWGAQLNEDKSAITPELALQILQRSIRVEQDRDTMLMNISATSEDPKQAAAIANEIANVYRERRLADKRREIQHAIDAMSNEVRKQQERVEEAEAELERIRQERGIALIGRGLMSIRVESTRLNALENERSAARVDMLVRKARMDQLEDLEGDKLMDAAAYIVQDPTLLSIRQQYIDSQVSLQLMLRTAWSARITRMFCACAARKTSCAVSWIPPSPGSRPASKRITKSPARSTKRWTASWPVSRRPISNPKAKIICPLTARSGTWR